MEWRPLKPGETFEERYRIEDILGIGGFAHVYRATQVDLDRDVALKVLRPVNSDDPASTDADETMERWVKRFKREAKVIADLRDPHTITMYDYGHTDSGMLYMVFEHISGQSLKEVLEESGPVSPRRAVAILRQSLSSLQEAHAMGILHRDIKPANIMVYDHVGRRDQVKILDFGIAKPMMDHEDATASSDLTQEGKIIGTPRYMAPEQLLGEGDTGPHSDIYSLGLVVYELIYGEQAVSGDTTMKIISKQVSEDPIEIPRASHVPHALHDLLEKMLQKNISERYQSADELLEIVENREESLTDPGTKTGSHEATARPDLAPSAADEPEGQTLADVELEPLDDIDAQPTAAVTQNRNKAEQDEDEEPAPEESSGPSRPLLAAVAVAVVAVAGLAAAVATDLFETTEQPAQESTAATGDEAPEVGPALDEASAQVASSVDSSVREAWTLTVETAPEGAQVFVEDRRLGQAPVQLGPDDWDAPFELRAELDDREADKVVEQPRPRLELELDEPAPDPVAERPTRPSPPAQPAGDGAPSADDETDAPPEADDPPETDDPPEADEPAETDDEPAETDDDTAVGTAPRALDAAEESQDDEEDEQEDDDHGFVPLD